METCAQNAYEIQLAPLRARALERGPLSWLAGEPRDARGAHAFALEWMTLSIHTQEHVERHMVEASYRCQGVGEHRLAVTMLTLASEAIEHYRRLADDARTLTQRWNQRHVPQIGHTDLLIQRTPPSIPRILAYHEQLLASPRPWAYLAGVHEANALFILLIPRLLVHLEHWLGPEIRADLRTVSALVDQQGRALPSTASTCMQSFVAHNPSRVDGLVEAGIGALERYADFVVDCAVAAANLASWRERAI